MVKAGIIYNESKDLACDLAEQVQKTLEAQGWQVSVATGIGGILGYSRPDSPVCHTPIDRLTPPGFQDDIKFALVLGGDGTVLSAFRQLAPCGIPLLTINTGHLGFLTEGYAQELDMALKQVLLGNYTIENRTMLTVQVLRDDTAIWEALSLNEMVLHKEPLTGMCHFEVDVGHHARVDIAADGLILSTPTGSTAYALSAGGPVITPGVSALQLVPICPHSLASRALVFANTEPVRIYPANPFRHLVMVVDGNAGCYIQPQDQVLVQQSPYSARFIRLRSPEFFHVLRQKLGWGLPHMAKPRPEERLGKPTTNPLGKYNP
ncbi:NAD(+) kinase [Candidatus Synechococcus calcipolaris G9]|uniref:NAD kinase n=1 Tax=Candidatus Synechococcus calcipolaris G9 TaxID=1497997 RepID=A0ABT6EWQ2_9SYNE|nr:NAD(+) kinase [Candidatus Synechococcus calcipolaris]MDG2989538.1 NAD(+) kinase [Candidatus Synechococcus calcipolaris G9]